MFYGLSHDNSFFFPLEMLVSKVYGVLSVFPYKMGPPQNPEFYVSQQSDMKTKCIKSLTFYKDNLSYRTSLTDEGKK